jgi:hypothetical protein
MAEKEAEGLDRNQTEVRAVRWRVCGLGRCGAICNKLVPVEVFAYLAAAAHLKRSTESNRMRDPGVDDSWEAAASASGQKQIR